MEGSERHMDETTEPDEVVQEEGEDGKKQPDEAEPESGDSTKESDEE